MLISDLIGEYKVRGTNQEKNGYSYAGILHLRLDEEKQRINAEWLINSSQIQSGTGFFKDNILVINFKYKGEHDHTFKGVIVYKCLTKDLLEGFWSEKHGNPLFLGSERCYRVNTSQELLD